MSARTVPHLLFADFPLPAETIPGGRYPRADFRFLYTIHKYIILRGRLQEHFWGVMGFSSRKSLRGKELWRRIFRVKLQEWQSGGQVRKSRTNPTFEPHPPANRPQSPPTSTRQTTQAPSLFPSPSVYACG
jgi:hypothetical protein